MAIFLNQPRYVWGCLGFYTNRTLGERVVQLGAGITGVALLSALVGLFSSVNSELGGQAVFLVVSAWLLVFGILRLFWTGVMWFVAQMFGWVAEGIPSMSSPIHYLLRIYWIVLEVFLSAAFLATLVAAVLVQFGVLSPIK